MTIFCCAALSSSPSRTPLSESDTLAAAASQAALSFARSSACWTRASSVPILNEGTWKGSVSPLSRPMVVANAGKGSSSKMRRGSDTRMYWVGCMVGYQSMSKSESARVLDCPAESMKPRARVLKLELRVLVSPSASGAQTGVRDGMTRETLRCAAVGRFGLPVMVGGAIRETVVM